MQEDDEGFLYPVADNEKCVGCGKCLKVCAFTADHEDLMPDREERPLAYAVKHRDEDVRRNSRSGGAFTAFSDVTLQHHGVVYGCAMVSNTKAKHIRTDNSVDRDKLRKSKYIQSDMSGIYDQIKQDLQSGKEVFFSGTSCQVAAVKRYCVVMGLNTEKLICMDILCHGCPSPLIWRDYIEKIKKEKGELIENVEFRDKEHFGWNTHIESMNVNGEFYSSKNFADIFYSHEFLRPACYKCYYRSVFHPSDITIGDFWRMEKTIPDFQDNKGVSLVLLNSDRGIELFNTVLNEIECRESSIEAGRQQTFKPYPEPKTREYAWKMYRSKGINGLIKYEHRRDRTIGALKRLKRKLLK